WASADQMICPAEKRDLLEANGLRLGVLVGAPPAALMTLLQTERTCVERHGRYAPSGVTVNQPLLAAKETVSCRIQHLDRVETASLDRPIFSLDFTPKRLGPSTIRLRIVPRIETGDKLTMYKAVPEESKWRLETKRTGQSLIELGCDVDLLMNQILLIGCRSDHEETFGYGAFVRVDGPEPMQRLLVLRHLRPSAATSTAAATP
ncbi:MAG TPA: hypothetical protein VHR72_02430, partial [Gemmataceae bacterium]|nr:hypothetical protein [Gemmataceae bacterium]